MNFIIWSAVILKESIIVEKLVRVALFNRSIKQLGHISLPIICFNFLLHKTNLFPLIKLYLNASLASFSFDGKNNPGVFK